MANPTFESVLKEIEKEMRIEAEADDIAYFKLLPEIHKIKLFCSLYEQYPKYYVLMHSDLYHDKCTSYLKQVILDSRCSKMHRRIVAKLLEELVNIQAKIKERRLHTKKSFLNHHIYVIL